MINLVQILDQFKSDPKFARNIVHWQHIPRRAGKYAEFPLDLDSRLADVLRSRGISQLYSHQRAAWDAIKAGKNPVVVTPTASGKTLCYNLPVLAAMAAHPEYRALYLFPTKALAQDQMDEVLALIDAVGLDIKAHTFDGDTPGDARKKIRAAGHIVITNPDMLHAGILPHHTKWIKLFENIKYVVIDEVHHYRGVFGSHLGNVLRRLKRVCAFYGSDPQFIACSATIQNPRELAEKLAETEFTTIDDNGAPAGEKHFIMINPPVVNQQLGIRKSALLQSRDVAAQFLAMDIPTIVFTPYRRQVELLLTYLRETMTRQKKSTSGIEGYRGGYLPNQRRAIERGLREGTIKGVVSTNALELGIDIGSLSAAVINGYPGSISSIWQQAGRAGRKQDVSVAVFVGNSSPVNQFLMTHPEYLFGRPFESGIIDPDNLVVLMSHIKCAAFEIPFEGGESFGAGPAAPFLEHLASERVVHCSKDKWFWASEVYPANEISLRSASPENFVILDRSHQNRVIGDVDYFSAPEFLHPKAIYLHGAGQYQVEELDWEGRRAYVKEIDTDYYTDAETKTDLKVLEVEQEALCSGGKKALGDVSLTSVAVLYKKIRFFTHENVGFGSLAMPEIEMHTTSFWYEFEPNFHEILDFPPHRAGEILHAAANALGTIVPLWVMSDVRDVRAITQVRSNFSQRPTIYLYDNIPGGVGLSAKIFRMSDELFSAAADLIGRCTCSSGCPSCVGPEGEIGPEGKRGAEKLLRWAAKGVSAVT
jgi:DEAD/DEAH box helicase domain-containing protein